MRLWERMFLPSPLRREGIARATSPPIHGFGSVSAFHAAPLLKLTDIVVVVISTASNLVPLAVVRPDEQVEPFRLAVFDSVDARHDALPICGTLHTTLAPDLRAAISAIMASVPRPSATAFSSCCVVYPGNLRLLLAPSTACSCRLSSV